jgi:hypothetical protein
MSSSQSSMFTSSPEGVSLTDARALRHDPAAAG